ncbi:unnamed protein product [Cylindrotheca closterium]|uniref:TehB/YeaR-like domain-containing protein n=1 Tax=Cylindrotheca closterium TaxID=2856 RepID=A0AAD2G5U1_9STRA|nr:unnamed protein product [Cylindrotheca closterium]
MDLSFIAAFTGALLHNPRRRHSSRTASSRSVLRMAMPELPPEMKKYSQVPSLDSHFTNDFIPSGLLKDHSTKDGTWGVIRLNKGELQYNIGEESFVLNASNPGIIEPNIKHSVKSLSEDLEFVVEFYRLPYTGPVDEPREGL